MRYIKVYLKKSLVELEKFAVRACIASPKYGVACSLVYALIIVQPQETRLVMPRNQVHRP